MGNGGLFIYSILAIIMNINDPGIAGMFVVVIPLAILSILNIYFITGKYRVPVSLYLKRKKLEEEIKIQEAENKLKDLRSQGLDSLKEKTETK